MFELLQARIFLQLPIFARIHITVLKITPDEPC